MEMTWKIALLRSIKLLYLKNINVTMFLYIYIHINYLYGYEQSHLEGGISRLGEMEMMTWATKQRHHAKSKGKSIRLLSSLSLMHKKTQVCICITGCSHCFSSHLHFTSLLLNSLDKLFFYHNARLPHSANHSQLQLHGLIQFHCHAQLKSTRPSISVDFMDSENRGNEHQLLIGRNNVFPLK